MKELIIFTLGVTVGAGVALLFAPESGEELRADIRAKADEELPRLRAGLDKTNERLNKMETDLKQALKRS
jgi:gas vesicle protein